MRRTILAVFAALATTVLLAGPASASGATTQHVDLSDYSGCSSWGPYTYCSTAKGEENVTSTPSGNWSGEVNANIDYTFAFNGTVEYSNSNTFHEHILMTDNRTVLQEGGVHYTDTWSYGGSVTCTYAYDVHVTNGNQIQYSNSTFSCS